MGTKYVDIPSIVQIIGNIYKNPYLLDDEKYFFNEEDFTEKFHRVIFGTIYNLYQLGAKEININTIEDYLKARPKLFAIYQTNKGQEYLEKISESVQLTTFDYYYQRMKKMTLLRSYNQIVGIDLSWLYDPDNILDVKKKQKQEDWLDNTPIADIAEIIDKKINEVRLKYADGFNNNSSGAGDGIDSLLQRLKETPEIGYPLYGPIINTITRGARLKKFYLRSGATGTGKTRAMIADACNIGCEEIFDETQNKWVYNGSKEPTLFIATEQDLEEVQTMMLAFLSNVNEEHILNGEYYDGEWSRVLYAANLLKQSPIYVVQLPDFSMQDIENTIKFHIHENKVKYVFYDYLHTSMKILSEITSKTQVKGLREDNILFMISTKLKDLCNQYGIFIMTSTQLNGSYQTAQQYDQNLLRGAKSIADRIDLGAIILEVNNDDIIALEDVLNNGGFGRPNIKISIYKNRRGRYKDILLWCQADRGTCRIKPMFVTNYQYELIAIEDLKINIVNKEKSAF